MQMQRWSLFAQSVSAALVSAIITGSSAVAEGIHSSFFRVIIVGATGDLAAKYLWVACFRLALEAKLARNQSVQFIAAARESQQEGIQWKERFFTTQWVDRVCGTTRGDVEDACRTFFTTEFFASIHYVPLQNGDHYAALASDLESGRYAHSTSHIERGRLVYLAIPPQAFFQVSRLLNEYLRPRNGTFFRVVIEKPFGQDYMTATSLASDLLDVLHTDEMLLMDHYAGKPTVRAIDAVVRRNGDTLGRFWNGQFISRIDITMQETETCEHRLEYFDQTGIIRDVMANHLQLVLCAVIASSLNHCRTGTGELCQDELSRYLQSLRPTGRLLVGQYSGYGAKSDLKSSTHTSRTVTAASVRVESVQEDWKNTAIWFTAAKAMRSRKAEVLVQFRASAAMNDGEAPCSVRFVIQEGQLSLGQRIEVNCSSLGLIDAPDGWAYDDELHRVLHPSRRSNDRSPWELGVPISAYDTLLGDAADGRLANFMKIDEVLASWKLWSPIIHAAEQLDASSIVEYDIGAARWVPDVAEVSVDQDGATRVTATTPLE